MSPALATEAAVVARRPLDGQSAQRLFTPSEATLEETILGAWEALDAKGRAVCPVCAGELEAAGCAGCGSELS